MNVKIDTMKSPNEIPEESRKRRLEDLDAGSLRLSTPSCYTNCDACWSLILYSYVLVIYLDLFRFI